MYRKNVQGRLRHSGLIVWDVLILQASYVLGFMIRHGWGEWPFLHSGYRSLAVVLAAADILAALALGTMCDVMKRGYLKELAASFKQAALVLVMITLYLFSAQAGDADSRITVCLAAGFHLILGYCFRILWKPLVLGISKRKDKRAMILVAKESAVSGILEKADDLDGFAYTGIILSDRDGTGETIRGVKVVSGLENAADYICRGRTDEVFVYEEQLSGLKTVSGETADGLTDDSRGSRSERSDRTADQSGVAELVEHCREMAIPVHICPPVSGAGGKSFTETVGGFKVLTMTANDAGPFRLAAKRFFDILGGLAGSFFAIILIAVIGPRIRKESPGPVLFKQTRIGLNGKRFTCYKLRSMYMDAEAHKKELMDQNIMPDGMMFKVDWDPRIIGNRIVDGRQITGIGEMIRRTCLDEFPQFFNILKGDMSLVGTRPPTEDEWEKYRYHHRARLSVKPGLTGIWQISDRSRITDFEEVVKLDTEYLYNWSIGLDIRILAKTVIVFLKLLR